MTKHDAVILVFALNMAALFLPLALISIEGISGKRILGQRFAQNIRDGTVPWRYAILAAVGYGLLACSFALGGDRISAYYIAISIVPLLLFFGIIHLVKRKLAG